MSLDRNAPANLALKQVFAGVDKLKSLGFKKKHINRMISIHIGRKQQSGHTAAMFKGALQALAGE